MLTNRSIKRWGISSCNKPVCCSQDYSGSRGANRFAAARTIRVPEGRIAAVEKVEDALDIPGIETVFWQKQVGDLVKASAESNEDIAGYVIAAGANKKTVDRALERFFETIKVEVK